VVIRELHFVLLGPPVPCARARVVRVRGTTRAITPDTTRRYENEIRKIALESRPDGWPLDARYRISLQVFRARAAGDWDNFAKAVCDGANGVLWEDDRRIFKAHVELVDRDPVPRMVVDVYAEVAA
jgi:crossover junction endodeoxyribonuclease RusA